ncbi:hypothetical protein SprV_0200589000 [Sparganum proliferum]
MIAPISSSNWDVLATNGSDGASQAIKAPNGNPTNCLTVGGILSSAASRQLVVLDSNPDGPIRRLLTRPSRTASISPHDVVHHIHTPDQSLLSPPRRLSPALFAAAKTEFEHMLQMDITRQPDSSWAPHLRMVPKAATSDWHPYGDHRVLNYVTIPDRYPVPHLQGFAGAPSLQALTAVFSWQGEGLPLIPTELCWPLAAIHQGLRF